MQMRPVFALNSNTELQCTQLTHPIIPSLQSPLSTISTSGGNGRLEKGSPLMGRLDNDDDEEERPEAL